jgi:hypothetical protein
MYGNSGNATFLVLRPTIVLVGCALQSATPMYADVDVLMMSSVLSIGFVMIPLIQMAGFANQIADVLAVLASADVIRPMGCV